MRLTKLLLSAAAVATLALPANAFAQHGADDAAHHGRKHRVVLVAHERHGADHR